MDIGILKKQIAALAEEAPQPVPVLANAAALLNESLENINWVGFYLVRNGELILGPFQGRPACVRIERGRGVCGTALATGEPQLVPDVHEFPGHIACDSASESEIVIPIRDLRDHKAERHAGQSGLHAAKAVEANAIHPVNVTRDHVSQPEDTGSNNGDDPARYGDVAAVLDIDSPLKGRFTEDDLRELTEFVMTLQEVIDWQ